MKTAEIPKEDGWARPFDHLLLELLGRVPSLKLLSLERLARVAPDSPHRADGLATVRAGNRKWTLVVEVKRNGQPRVVRGAVLQLEESLRLLPGRAPRYGVVLAPFISEASASLCVQAGIGYADLAGNARLAFDQVFIETRAAGNALGEKKEVRSLFAPRAARALRVLLQGPLRPWKVTALAAAARVSVGWVSAVRQRLLAREWAVDAPGGLQVTKPGALLDAWAEADDWEKRTSTREYSLLVTDPAEIATRAHRLLGGQRHAFTQWIAAALRHPHTTPPLVTAYVEEFPDDALLKEALLARRVDSGGRLRLVRAGDEGVFNPLQTVEGLPLVSDVQLYLDLIHAGLRGNEAAAELRKWPDFAGAWA